MLKLWPDSFAISSFDVSDAVGPGEAVELRDVDVLLVKFPVSTTFVSELSYKK